MSTEDEKKVELNEKGDNGTSNTESSEIDEEKKAARQQAPQVVDESDPSKVVLRGVKGTVKWFSISKGFGFIHREDNDKDVFVHSTAIVQRDDRRWSYALSPEQVVEFDVVSGFKGPKAQAVTLPGGQPVETLRLYERSFRRFRGGFRGQRRRSKSANAEESAEKKENNGRRRYASDGNESGGDLKENTKNGKRKSEFLTPLSRHLAFSGRRRNSRKTKEDKVAETGAEEQERVEKKEAELVTA